MLLPSFSWLATYWHRAVSSIWAYFLHRCPLNSARLCSQSEVVTPSSFSLPRPPVASRVRIA